MLDIDEYCFYKKRKDKNFSIKKFAKFLGISRETVTQLGKKRKISPIIAWKIELYTLGEINAWELLKKTYKLDEITYEGVLNESGSTRILPNTGQPE